MSRHSLGRRRAGTAHTSSPLRSPVLSRHLAPDTAARRAARLGATHHALRNRAAGRWRAILFALALACAGVLIAVPRLMGFPGSADDEGRSGDDGVFSDQIERGTGGQGGGVG